MKISFDQAKILVEEFGGDEDAIMELTESDHGHSGPGLYVHCADYPEEGATFLGSISI